MIGRFLRRVFVLAVVGGAVAVAVRLLRGEATPAFELPTEPIQLRPAAPSAPVAADPIDGGCPDGFPVKAKLKSGIFREPGMANYESTTPDRCYRTAAAAEADGLRAAKR